MNGRTIPLVILLLNFCELTYHRNDIRVLELEYPIYTRMGAGGGVFILDSSRLQQRWLTVRQRELLMDVCSVLDDEQALLMRSIIGGLSP